MSWLCSNMTEPDGNSEAAGGQSTLCAPGLCRKKSTFAATAFSRKSFIFMQSSKQYLGFKVSNRVTKGITDEVYIFYWV